MLLGTINVIVLIMEEMQSKISICIRKFQPLSVSALLILFTQTQGPGVLDLYHFYNRTKPASLCLCFIWSWTTSDDSNWNHECIDMVGQTLQF